MFLLIHFAKMFLLIHFAKIDFIYRCGYNLFCP